MAGTGSDAFRSRNWSVLVSADAPSDVLRDLRSLATDEEVEQSAVKTSRVSVRVVAVFLKVLNKEQVIAKVPGLLTKSASRSPFF